MTALFIQESDIPSLDGKVAVVTGGASGIGLGAAQILLDHGAYVIVLDIQRPPAEVLGIERFQFIDTDITSWKSLVSAFQRVSERHDSIDIAIANAGLGGDAVYLTECLTPAPTTAEEWEKLADREDEIRKIHRVVDVNIKGTSDFVMLASKIMKRQEEGGSIVITTSATAYRPEFSMPMYCATKGALTNLIRTLRATLINHNISISGVAPSATISGMLSQELAGPIIAQNLPVSSSRRVGLALVYSAVARQSSRVEDYGMDAPLGERETQRWNGRVIMTLGDTFTEVEKPLAEQRGSWWGSENDELTTRQQCATDFRSMFN